MCYWRDVYVVFISFDSVGLHLRRWKYHVIKGMSHMLAIFSFDLFNSKCCVLIQTSLQWDIWLQRYEQFLGSLNNIKHKNYSPLSACRPNSTPIFVTSGSFSLIMSQIILIRIGCLAKLNDKTSLRICFEFVWIQKRLNICLSILLTFSLSSCLGSNY